MRLLLSEMQAPSDELTAVEWSWCDATCYLVHSSHGIYVHAIQQHGFKPITQPVINFLQYCWKLIENNTWNEYLMDMWNPQTKAWKQSNNINHLLSIIKITHWWQNLCLRNWATSKGLPAGNHSNEKSDAQGASIYLPLCILAVAYMIFYYLRWMQGYNPTFEWL